MSAHEGSAAQEAWELALLEKTAPKIAAEYAAREGATASATISAEQWAKYVGCPGCGCHFVPDGKPNDTDAAPAPAVPVQGRGKAAQGKATIPPG